MESLLNEKENNKVLKSEIIMSNEELDISNLVFPEIKNIIILTFDNEVGQIVDKEFPKEGLNKNILKVISIKGFPETNQISAEGEIGYIFKVRTNSSLPLKYHLVDSYSFLYCYVLFIQIKNKSMKRGYIQKSIIVTSNEFSKPIIFKLLYIIKESLFMNNEISYEYLENIFYHFNNASKTIKLKETLLNNNKLGSHYLTQYLERHLNNNFLFENNKIDTNHLKINNNNEVKTDIDYQTKDKDNIFKIDLVEKSSSYDNELNKSELKTESFNLEDKTVSSLSGYNSDRNNSKLVKNILESEINNKISTMIPMHYNFYRLEVNWHTAIKLNLSEFQFNNFMEVFSLFYVAKLWQIWELVVLEYPILVFADDASRVSNIVFLLESITSPLPLSSDIRPYFSIYDPDFKEYKEETELREHNSAILGVINPIFIKLIPDWPVVLRFDEYFFNNDLKIKLNASPLYDPLSGKMTEFYDSKIKKSSTLYEVKKYMKKSRYFALKGNPQIIALFLDCLKSQGQEAYGKLNHHLRAHFIELTRDFMKTIDDFVLLNEIKEIKRITLQKKDFSIFEIFNKENFMKYLKEKCDRNAFNYKYVHDKKKLINLYTEYLKTKCFRNHMTILLNQIKNK
jgi:hypothetical protein